MTSLVQAWQRLAVQARIGIIAGIILIAGLAVSLGIWAYRADYQVLFSDVAPADAAAMTAELDRMKTPYQLTDGGNTILVPKDLVYKTRLKLMGKEMPLHGAVGFEVFNNADFGMTEFVQKVNYLRAIQGELTRTILSIEEIQAARVHLAIPEQGLFKKALTKPKASVTLTMKAGRTLAAAQVAGIQRLVAASVPDIVSDDVTVLNQHGVALTRIAQADGGDAGVAQLDAKRSTEEYLAKKVTEVLDRTFGAGATVASVDVALNLDQSRITTEEVLPAKGASADAPPAGVIVRDRQTSREGNTALAAGDQKNLNASGSSSEADYQVGRRVEQLVQASGTVKRMTVAVLVKQPLTAAQLEQLKEIVALAIGVSSQRGDAVVVYSMEQFAQSAERASPAPATTPVPPAAPAVEPPAAVPAWPLPLVDTLLAIMAVLCATGVLYLLARRRNRRRAEKRLDPAARQQLLNDVRQWISTPQGGALYGERK